jgi:hypothetical protein
LTICNRSIFITAFLACEEGGVFIIRKKKQGILLFYDLLGLEEYREELQAEDEEGAEE